MVERTLKERGGAVRLVKLAEKLGAAVWEVVGDFRRKGRSGQQPGRRQRRGAVH